jgi:hypothetical protein
LEETIKHFSFLSMSGLPPAPNGQVLSLVSALSNTENHELHVHAIRARDEALSASSESYGNLCLQLSFLLVGSDQPQQLLQRIDPSQLEVWRQTDMTTALRLQSDINLWVPFGQMAGLILKNALLRPPILPNDGRVLSLVSPQADHVKETLLFCLGCAHSELRNVASSVIATTSVSPDGLQPALHIQQWPQLMPALLASLQPQTNGDVHCQHRMEGALSTIRKMMEDGPDQISQQHLDELVPLLLRFFQSNEERPKVSALQSFVACLAEGLMPNALVLHFSEYLNGLSALAMDPSPMVRKWVCRSINTLLELRTEYLQPHMEAICQFMLQSTQDLNHDSVAVEACEFWLTFSNLEESECTLDMLETVERLLPQLIPVLLQSMVYSREQQIDLQARNELDQEEGGQQHQMKPVFHLTRNKHGGGGDQGDDGDDDDDDDDMDDDESNEWTLRKYAGASLDSLANLYGAEPILPHLLPVLQEGLSSKNPWVQEASILALGAIADGCREEMSVHMAQLHPYLMTLLAAPENLGNLPQVKSICAWTIGRYAAWAVEQVQTGAQGHLLAHMTEVFLQRLADKNRRVQVACGSAFGVVMESAGDLMVPYLEPVYQGLVSAMSRYQGRSLIIIFDTLGIMADFCGPAIGEGNLPQIYVPPMLYMLDGLLKNDPTDRTLLPLMESLASVALSCGMNYQPYALETFDNAMCTIEQVQLLLAGSEDHMAEEDADPIVCATDLLDGLCEGLGGNFATLVVSSSRYGQHFQSVLHALIQYQLSGVRMSGLALLGDLTRNAPSLIEPVFPQLLHDAIANINPVQPSVCNNAVWAIGEMCVRCGENPSPLEPFASSLMQQLIGLLVGNGPGRSSDIPGLAENAAACAGRLANVNPNFVAPELSRFLLGWCDGLARITDQTERRDAFTGFSKAVYANPQAIQQASTDAADAISSILYAIVSWHMPPETEDLLSGDYGFQPFPQTEGDLGNRLAQLMRDMKASAGEDTWKAVQNQLPVNVRRLLREAYQV